MGRDKQLPTLYPSPAPAALLWSYSMPANQAPCRSLPYSQDPPLLASAPLSEPVSKVPPPGCPAAWGLPRPGFQVESTAALWWQKEEALGPGLLVSTLPTRPSQFPEQPQLLLRQNPQSLAQQSSVRRKCWIHRARPLEEMNVPGDTWNGGSRVV